MNSVVIDDALPISYCGLDRLFNSCPKMFIVDVLKMPEVDATKGYAYIQDSHSFTCIFPFKEIGVLFVQN